MPVKIRLARRGRKFCPSYSVVVADSRAPRDGRFLERLGYYDPIAHNHKINAERALSWLANGAQPTDTVRTLLSKHGILFRRHLQIGVDKGAITQDLADKRFEEWELGRAKRIVDAQSKKNKKTV